MIYIFIIFTILSYLLIYNIRRISLYKCGWKLPGPLSFPIIGTAYKFIGSAKELQPTFHNMSLKYGHIYRFWLGPELNIIVTDPNLLQKVLLSNNVLEKGPSYKYIREYLGMGLLSSGGLMWKNQRKQISHCFNRKTLCNQLQIINFHSKNIVKHLEKIIHAGTENKHNQKFLMKNILKKEGNEKVFDVFHEICEGVHLFVCETLLGIKPSEELLKNSEFIHHVEKIYDVTFSRMTKWWFQFDFLFKRSRYYQMHLEVTKLMDKFFKYIYKEKFTTMKNKTVPLDFIIDENTNFKDFSTNAFTLQTASEESISTIVSFVLVMLGIHQDIQSKLSQELFNIFAGDNVDDDNNGDVTVDHLSQLVYLDAVVKETLRLFPIGTVITRFVYKDLQLTDKITIPKQSVITIPIYVIHRHPDLWIHPEKFIPERFLEENEIHPGSFLPFSYGPMNCIGQTYAMWAIKTLLIHILRHFWVFTPFKDINNVELITDISIRPVNGYLIQLKKKE